MSLPRSAALLLFAFSPMLPAAQVVVPAPPGSGAFGHEVRVLPNGNFLVVDPLARGDNGAAVGAVHLYRFDGTRLSTLRGASADDGTQLRTVLLRSGNALAVWPFFDDGAAHTAGAVTFIPADRGVDGVVGLDNSLIGDSQGAGTGSSVLALANGNYVVGTPQFSGGAPLGGAVTWGSGTTGVKGRVSVANSLYGDGHDDFVGGTLVALANGNYVVGSSSWHAPNGDLVGAATWGDGERGTVGPVSASNSLVGASPGDGISTQGITALANGHYVVRSPSWRNGNVRVGAATWGNGNGGTVGVVSASNSLIGGTAFDAVGAFVVALANGHYVVSSAGWDNGAIANAGFAAWANGNGGTTGVVSSAMAQVGAAANDAFSQQGVIALANGNYVVHSANYTQGGVVVGATTWGDGQGGSVGVAGPGNSLLGTANAQPATVTALANGHYVVSTTGFDRPGAADTGAVTWRPGDEPAPGTPSTANSLVGASAGDQVGELVVALEDGSYVVGTPVFDNGALANAGAAMHLPGDGPTVRTFAAADALFGPKAGDLAGSQLLALAGGNFLVGSPVLQIGGVAVGAATVSTPDRRSAAIGATNSRVGGTANDRVGSLLSAAALPDGDFTMHVSLHDRNGVDTGAVHLGDGTGTLAGTLDDGDTVFGAVPGQGSALRSSYDPLRKQLVVGDRAANRVVLLRRGAATTTAVVQDGPDPSLPGQAVNVVVTVASATPPAGRVEITASSGERCSDDSAVATSPTTANYACTLTFAQAGARTLTAQFFGDGRTHAFSASGQEPHAVATLRVFGDGFE